MEYDGIHAPVRAIPTDGDAAPVHGAALCLSGGGFRAMLFHLGVVWRLNEAGWLPRLSRISSVSGGSLTAGAVAAAWPHLDFDDTGVARRFADLVAEPLLRMAGRAIDIPSVLSGIALPGVSAGERLAAAYRRHLFGDVSLRDLPRTPRFIFNATNLETGSLVRFSRRSLADWKVGKVPEPDLPLAVAVACSSAFPPFLAPYVLHLADQVWRDTPQATHASPGFRARMSVADGGVYDNLGLETAWQKCRLIMVSDAGGRLRCDPEPPGDWARDVLRVLEVIDGQVRDLRRRQILDALRTGERDGMYVGIGSDLARCPVPDPLPVEHTVTRELAAVPTRLNPLPVQTRQRLVNWGHALADGWLRARVEPTAPRGTAPYPAARLTRPTAPGPEPALPRQRGIALSA